MIKFDKNSEKEIATLIIKPEKIICPDCGGLTTDGMAFCERCGGELEPLETEQYEALRERFGDLL
ncbi:MAG: hypothetical protein J6Z02_00105 [Lachnospiraceae bacterium]|nr:hypothetical protein [Lachnospiraceae bacterium]